MRRRSFTLGKLQPDALVRALRSAWKSNERWGAIARQEAEELRRALAKRDPYYAYAFMNSLGYFWGSRMAEELLAPLVRMAEERVDPDIVVAETKKTLAQIAHMYRDIENIRTLRSPSVIRRAAEDVPEVVPARIKIEKAIKDAIASWEGTAVYFNDFHYNVEGILQGLYAYLADMVLYHERPEEIAAIQRQGLVSYMPETFLRDPGIFNRALDAASEQARQRTFYGLRPITLPAAPFFSILTWDNGAAEWYTDYMTTEWAVRLAWKGRREISLDANQILIPYPPYVAARIAPWVEPLPLYHFSTEARGRGEDVLATGLNVRRILRSLMDQNFPQMDSEERQLEAMTTYEIFDAARRGDPGSREAAMDWLKRLPDFPPGFWNVLRQWIQT